MSQSNDPFSPGEFHLPDPQSLAANLSTIVEQSQHLIHEHMKRQLSGDNFTIPDANVIARSFLEMTQHLLANPAQLMHTQMEFWQQSMALWEATSRRLLGQDAEPIVDPAPGDKRFKDDAWTENVIFDYIKQSYLLAARSIQKTVSEVEGLDPKTAERVDFYTRQMVDSMAPTNFATSNPKVIKTTLETGGENLLKGLQNLLGDLERGKGELRIRMTDLDAFELGVNVAATPGKVVFQNELMQLIQYHPSTEEVHKRPLLVVPPWINKFYILDLKPKNSFIKWAVDQGFTVFTISWVNPDERLAQKDFSDYMREGPLAALDAIADITGEREVNAISYCLGGTLLMSTLAYMSAHNDNRIKSATCFTTMLDFTQVGELGVFIDEEQITLIEEQMEKKGYLEGSKMANVFNMLRSNDLIWSFVVNNYLLGKDPMAFDLLYWNSDSTRMPAVMHSFYLRNMYQYNRLKEPGSIVLDDTPIDLRQIKTPVYFLSAREDHIAPWKGTYDGARLPSGPVRFVLGGSGHIAGVINPAGSPKYGYWLNDKMPEKADDWLSGATQQEGSWWPDWYRWVRPKAGKQVPAREIKESLEDAPGSYVKVRID